MALKLRSRERHILIQRFAVSRHNTVIGNLRAERFEQPLRVIMGRDFFQPSGVKICRGVVRQIPFKELICVFIIGTEFVFIQSFERALHFFKITDILRFDNSLEQCPFCFGQHQVLVGNDV